MLFNNKEEFKKLYVDRLTSKYGKSPADAHIYEKYDVLGELVRDYSGTNWRNTRDYVINNEKKQLKSGFVTIIGRPVDSLHQI